MTVKEHHPDLETLIQVQELESRVSQLQRRVEEIPIEIAALEEEKEKARSDFAQRQARVESHDRELRQLEAQVEDLKERLSKYKSQLMEVKTNEAYQAMLNEIEFTEKKIEEKEDRILEYLVAADEEEADLKHVRKHFEKTEKETSQRRKELEEFVSRSEDDLERLRNERDRVLSLLPGELINLYNRIAAARKGVAVAPVEDQCCGICHFRLRPQLFAEVKNAQGILTCENCSRILYLPNSAE